MLPTFPHTSRAYGTCSMFPRPIWRRAPLTRFVVRDVARHMRRLRAADKVDGYTGGRGCFPKEWEPTGGGGGLWRHRRRPRLGSCCPTWCSVRACAMWTLPIQPRQRWSSRTITWTLPMPAPVCLRTPHVVRGNAVPPAVPHVARVFWAGASSTSRCTRVNSSQPAACGDLRVLLVPHVICCRHLQDNAAPLPRVP